jgi:hypothetical protein
VKHRRNAILWAIGWWIVRRQVRRRAAVAVAGVGATATAQRGRIRAVLGAVLLVGLLAAGLIAARKLLASGEPGDANSLTDMPPFPDVPSFPDAPDAPDAPGPAEPDPGPAPA